MQRNISAFIASSIILFGLGFADQVFSDELTRTIQEDLIQLGYDPGINDGEPSTATAIAIAKFEADRDMTVTGEVTPQLGDALSDAVSEQGFAGPAFAEQPTPVPEQDPAMLQAAQQECLQKKMDESREAQKKKRGFGSLLRAVSRTASRTGNYDLARTAGDVYSANASAADLSSAAKDLGITEDEIAACQKPL
jgi:peptidoglycan hydrolase-like protein with peptidoglycan-binding domain